MIGKTLGQYEIVGPLGSGGMGDVYRALDTNLKREVAIKVLPQALSADEGRLARLQREAHLLAAVNHPNIAAIYNFEESEGTRWLVLELVEGTTLEQELRGGPFSLADSLRIAAQVASALEAAHEKGIVHRDLKSANIMVDNKGRVKVLDFGIAKDVSGGGGIGGMQGSGAGSTGGTYSSPTQAATGMAAQLTATGMLVGTVPYMSPEQVRGKQIDKRTDNWAFGCLLFELLTGRRPFDRETMADTLSAILEHEPEWDLLPPDTPEPVLALIRRCLQKDANVRLHDIADARVEIGEIETTQTGVRITTGTGGYTGSRTATGSRAATGARDPGALSSWTPSPKMKIAATFAVLLATVVVVGWGLLWGTRDAGSRATEVNAPAPVSFATVPDVVAIPNSIAVLPFRSDPEDSKLAFGLAEEVLNRLSKVSGLRTVSATSSSQIEDMMPANLGQRLGVSKLLQGGVRTNGDQLIVTVQLLDAASLETIDSGEFDGTIELDSIFDIQRSIALQVVGALEVELIDEEAALVAAISTTSYEAYGAYLDGLSALRLRTKESLDEAIRHFRRAASLDPDYALAHVGIANSYLLLGVYGGVSTEVAALEANVSVEAARAIDPELAEIAVPQAGVYVLRGDRQRDAALQRAVELNPNDPLAHQMYGSRVFFQQGATDRAFELIERARTLDPLGGAPHETLAWLLFDVGRVEEALAMANKAVELEPEYPLGHWVLGSLLQATGRADLGTLHLERMKELNPADDTRSGYLARAYQALGRNEEAAEMHKDRVNVDPNNANRWTRVGDFYRDIGEFDTAADWYQGAIDREEDAAFVFQARMALLDLNRDDVAAAERLVAEAEAAAPNNRYTKHARINLDMYNRRYVEGAESARELGNDRAGRFGRGYLRSMESGEYTNWEPVGYFGVLAGRAADSRSFFATAFPDLFESEAPLIFAGNLQVALDAAAVLTNTGEQERADLLLRKSTEFLDAVVDVQRRNEFPTARMQIYALQGRTAEALEAMREAIDDGWRNGWWRLEHMPHFATLHAEPEFQEMVAELRAEAGPPR